MAQLTERQQQIVGLQKEGKTAPQIAEALSITTNAVYQQIRRMRGGAAKPKAAKKSGPKSAGTKTTASSGTTGTANVTATPTPAPRPLTPLQSLRSRRDEISADIKEAQSERDAALRTYAKAQESLEKLSGRYAEELARLDAAEHALKGTSPEPEAVAAPEPAPEPAPAAAKANGTTPPKRKTAAQAAAEKKAKEDAAKATSAAAPTTQTEREATADFDPATPAEPAKATA